MPVDHPGPGLGPEDAPGQIVIMDGVEYVVDETGRSPELERAIEEQDQLSEAIAATMRDESLAVTPCGNPYKQD